MKTSLGSKWDCSPEWRLRQPWPPGMRFSNARTERIIERRRPPKPVNVMGCAGGACAESVFAENVMWEPHPGRGGRRPCSLPLVTSPT
jgi:hypothetical protein